MMQLPGGVTISDGDDATAERVRVLLESVYGKEIVGFGLAVKFADGAGVFEFADLTPEHVHEVLGELIRRAGPLEDIGHGRRQ